jgi:hypothetical protein
LLGRGGIRIAVGLIKNIITYVVRELCGAKIYRTVLYCGTTVLTCRLHIEIFGKRKVFHHFNKTVLRYSTCLGSILEAETIGENYDVPEALLIGSGFVVKTKATKQVRSSVLLFFYAWLAIYRYLSSQISLKKTFFSLSCRKSFVLSGKNLHLGTGTVQRKITEVGSYHINREVFHSHCTADMLVLKLKVTFSLNCKNLFQRLKPKYVAYPFRGMRHTSTALYFYGASKTSLHKPSTSENMLFHISYGFNYYLQLMC